MLLLSSSVLFPYPPRMALHNVNVTGAVFRECCYSVGRDISIPREVEDHIAESVNACRPETDEVMYRLIHSALRAAVDVLGDEAGRWHQGHQRAEAKAAVTAALASEVQEEEVTA